MLLVIIKHSTYLIIDTPYGKISYANDVSTPVYSIVHKLTGALTVFIYSFHMPLFMQ